MICERQNPLKLTLSHIYFHTKLACSNVVERFVCEIGNALCNNPSV